MGSQQLAVDVDGRPVLRKVAPAGSPAAARLAGEARVLQAAAHPRVAQLVGFHADLDGEARLELRVAGTRALADLGGDLAGGVRVLAALASTVADLHELGIAHGRLTADHVVLDASGGPVLCGFAGAGPVDAVDPAGDVAAIGELLAALLRRCDGADADWEPIPERRFGRSARWDGFARRALLHLADQATADERQRRPTARALAAALSTAIPEPRPRGRRRWLDAARPSRGAPASPDAPHRPPAGWRDHLRPTGAGRGAVGSATVGAGGGAVVSPAVEVGRGAVGSAAVEVGGGAASAPDAAVSDELAARRIAAARRRHPSWGGARRADAGAAGAAVSDGPADAVELLRRLDPVAPPPPRRSVDVGRVAAVAAGAVGLGLLVFGVGALLRPAAPGTATPDAAPADAALAGPPAAPTAGGALAADPADRPAGEGCPRGAPGCPGPTCPPGPAPATDPSGCAPAGCPPAPAPAADPDGDGCASPVAVGDAVVEVDGVRYGVGRPGDLLVLGDWDCDGASTVALVRPGSGEVFVFDGWAAADAARTATSSGTVPGAAAAERAPRPGGCDALVVVDGAGRRTEVPT